MKTIRKLFTAAAALMTVSASAQITLDAGSYSAWQPIADTVRRIDIGASQVVLAAGSNMVWNLSNVSYSPTTRYYARNSATSTAFPTATFYDSAAYRITPGLSYNFMRMGKLTANGFLFMGEHVDRQAFSITSVSGGANDSLIFPQQDIPFTTDFTTIAFPATMGSNWGSEYNFTTNFNLTVLMYGLNNAPCQRKTYVTQKDTVVGWGTMSVKDKQGIASAQMNVLMTKVYIAQVDSFFLNGSPAPAIMLSAFGLTQGQIIKNYQYKFYRAGELMPLLFADYADSTFSDTNVNGIDIHVEHLDYPTGINDVSGNNSVVAYPNPVSNNTLNIQIIDKTTTNLTFSVINMNGQIVSNGNLNFNEGAASISTNEFSTPGIYYLQLYKPNGQITAILPININ